MGTADNTGWLAFVDHKTLGYSHAPTSVSRSICCSSCIKQGRPWNHRPPGSFRLPDGTLNDPAPAWPAKTLLHWLMHEDVSRAIGQTCHQPVD